LVGRRKGQTRLGDKSGFPKQKRGNKMKKFDLTHKVVKGGCENIKKLAIALVIFFFMVLEAFAGGEFTPAILPSNVVAQKPGPEVPADIAAFFGKTGKREGQAVRIAYGAQYPGPYTKLVFKNISSKKAEIIIARGSTPSQNKPGGVREITAVFSRQDGKVVLTFPIDYSGYAWEYTLEGEGQELALVGHGAMGRSLRLKQF
jgi:hypothetical protein